MVSSFTGKLSLQDPIYANWVTDMLESHISTPGFI